MIGSYDSGTKLVTSGLVLWQDFGWTSCYPGSGTSTKNLASASVGDGVISGSPTFSSSTGFDFTGSEGISFGSDASYRPTAAITVGAWLYFDSIDSNHRPVNDWWGSPDERWIFYCASSTEFWWYVGSTSVSLYNSDGFVTGGWKYIVGTFDASLASNEQKVYLQGSFVRQASNSISAMATPNNTNGWGVETGLQSSTGGTGMDGRVSQVQIWNRALTATEITQNYNAHKTRYGL